MTRISPFILFFVAVCACLPVTANDVYVYKTGDYTPVLQLQNIRSIVVSSSKITVKTNYNTSQEVALIDFDYLRFYKTPVPTGIKSAKGQGANFLFDGKNINVQSKTTIKAVELIGSNGATVAKIQPGSKTFTYKLDELPKGVYLVKMTASDGTTSVEKIVK